MPALSDKIDHPIFYRTFFCHSRVQFSVMRASSLETNFGGHPGPKGRKIIKQRNRSHEVATAAVGIAVATAWLERPGAFLIAGSRPQLSAVATSWLLFLPQCIFLSWTLSLSRTSEQLFRSSQGLPTVARDRWLDEVAYGNIATRRDLCCAPDEI